VAPTRYDTKLQPCRLQSQLTEWMTTDVVDEGAASSAIHRLLLLSPFYWQETL